MKVKECNKCGSRNNFNSMYCSNCSQSLKEANIIETLPEKSNLYKQDKDIDVPLQFPLNCPECGILIEKKTMYCPECRMVLTKGHEGEKRFESVEQIIEKPTKVDFEDVDVLPICPHCEKELKTIQRVRKNILNSSVIYICPSCRKVLSIGFIHVNLH